MMRLLLVMWLLVSSLVAGPQEEAFLRAAYHYRMHDYEKALDLYQTLEPKQSSVWYNMGNCAYHRGDYVQACLWWKMAAHGANHALRSAIRHNLRRCLPLLGKSPEQEGLAGFIQYVYTVLTKIHVGIAQVIFLVLWGLLLLLIIAGRRVHRVIFFVLSAGVIMSGGIVLLQHRAHGAAYAMVRDEAVTLYAGPGERYHVIGNLDCLDQVNVCQAVGEWLKVSSKKGVGWVPAKKLEIIECAKQV